MGGEGNDMLIMTGIEIDQQAEGGPGDDDFYVFGNYNQMVIRDDEGLNRIFLPDVVREGLQWYQEESGLVVEYYNDSDFPEFELVVEKFFSDAPSFEGIYVNNELWLTPDSINQAF